MEQIKNEKLNLTIENSHSYSFEVMADGMYLIEIIASAKSWWQNLITFESFFQDDDLSVKIDGFEFPKLNGKKGLFDGEAAWNGNNLKGLSKIVIFIIKLEKGGHNIGFIADQNPTLESISIFKIDGLEADYVSQKNNPAQDGNRRQWMTIIPVNVSLKSIIINASAKNYRDIKDDDDLKIIIDGNIQKNKTDKAHENWYWCGKILDGKEKEFSSELSLKKGLHYVELWADKMPALKNIRLVLEENYNVNNEASDDPEKIKEGFNPEYVLKDSAFSSNKSMSEIEIQAFLSDFNETRSSRHISNLKFEGKEPSFWIKKAADSHSINPRLLLAKLQIEQRLVKGEMSIDPSAEQLNWAMGVGALDNGARLKEFEGFIAQVDGAAKYFRKHYDEARKVNFTHENVDGKPLKVVNSSTYSLYKYTPHIEGVKLMYDVYAGFFGTEDLGGTIKEDDLGNAGKILNYPLIFLGICFLMVFSIKSVFSYFESRTNIYSNQKSIDLQNNLRLSSEIEIFSQKKAAFEDGSYCGFRQGKIYEYNAVLNLYQGNAIIDSVDLTNPELVFSELSDDYLFYYQPYDIDQDGKAQEFIVAKYANCNGNFVEFMGVNTNSKKLEKIPIVNQNGEEKFSVYADISPASLQINDDAIKVRFYSNTEWANNPEGFYVDYYKFDKEKGKLIWFKSDPN